MLHLLNWAFKLQNKYEFGPCMNFRIITHITRTCNSSSKSILFVVNKK